MPFLYVFTLICTQGGKDVTAKLDKTVDGQITFVSGENDTVLSKLPAGKYTLIEDTAPLGYTKAASIDFVIDKEGKITVDEKAVASVDMTDKLITATNTWLLAHAESSEAKNGAWVGITGENLDIASDI